MKEDKGKQENDYEKLTLGTIAMHTQPSPHTASIQLKCLGLSIGEQSYYLSCLPQQTAWGECFR